MNILQVNQDISTKGGGVARMIREYAPFWAKEGHNVFTLTSEKLDQKIDGITNIYSPLVTATGGCDRSEVEHIAKQYDIDVVQFHEVKNLDLLEEFLRRIPSFVFLHNYGWWCPGNDLFHSRTEENCDLTTCWKCVPNAYIKKCNNRHPKHLVPSVRNAYRKKGLYDNENIQFVTSSEYLIDRAVKAGIPKEKLDKVAYGINAGKFESKGKQVEEIESNYILYVGRLSKSKGVHYLLDSYSELDTPKPQLVIVGDGQYAKQIKTKASSLEIMAKVRFLGWRGDRELAWLYGNCEFLVVPSIWDEVFGIVGIEAMASRKPVIAFDVGGIHNWLRDGYNGYLVERKNRNMLRAKMEKLLQNTEQKKKMGNNGYTYFKENFIAQKQSDSLLEIYKKGSRTG
ncbi:glycosyltransferase family 4 protein [Fodinibius sp. AD559]|uniref:glycosyltransferase family 4 protein n=1 Tax=Fodinibius sp. AD559 TaxID=3424179 RepID=UPI004046A896